MSEPYKYRSRWQPTPALAKTEIAQCDSKTQLPSPAATTSHVHLNIDDFIGETTLISNQSFKNFASLVADLEALK